MHLCIAAAPITDGFTITAVLFGGADENSYQTRGDWWIDDISIARSPVNSVF